MASPPTLIWIARVTAMLVALIGLTVLFGWVTGNASIIQLQPQFPPMQFNTAMSFLALGLSLVFLQRRPRLAVFAGIMVALVGLLTLLQYMFSVDFAIDELFIQHTITVSSSHPGRMAPNTALCFSLAGAALILYSCFRQWPLRTLVTVSLAAAVICLALVALFGYFSNIETAYGWGQFTRMAIHTSIAFLLFGIGLLSRIRHETRRVDSRSANWSPVMVAVFGITATLLLWQAIHAREHAELNRLLNDQADEITLRMQSALSHQWAALIRMKLQLNYGMPVAAWRSGARQFLEDYPDINALVWLNAQAQPFAHETSNPNYPTDIRLSKNTLGEAAKLDTAQFRRRSQTGTSAYELVTVLSIHRQQNTIEYLLAALDYQQLLETKLDVDARRDFNIQVYDARLHLAGHGQIDPALPSLMRTLMVGNQMLNLRLQPTPSGRSAQRSWLPLLILIAGTILSALITLTVWLMQISQQRAKALSISEQRVRSITNNLFEALILIDRNSIIHSVNPATEQVFGYRPEELIGQHLKILFPESQRANGEQFLQRTYRAPIGQVSEWQAQRKTGEVFPFELSLYEINAENGEPQYACLCADISMRKQAEQALRQQEEQFRTLAENAPVGIMQLDLQGRIQYVNTRWAELTGSDLDQPIGLPWTQAVHPEDRAFTLEAWRRAIHNKDKIRIECRLQPTAENTRWVIGNLSPLFDTRQQLSGYLGTIMDISERKQAEALLQELSYTDELTGLHNRRGFLTLAEQQIKIARRQTTPLQLAFIDMDGMKAINDRFGHAVGDQAINDIAEALRQTFRDADILARIGGDEFAVLVIGADENVMNTIRMRLLSIIEKMNRNGQRHYALSVSIGSATYDLEHSRTLEQCLEEADRRMYEVKGNKRRRS